MPSANVKDDRSGSGRQEHKQGEKGFGKVLEAASSKAKEASDIRVRTTGYSRFGAATVYLVNMKDYTYQTLK